ncbi:MAG: hypothetical protein KJP23_14430, partial [Deltaproteobacteria bacterium]|nr:hypothetical protein [Deltaproteobacteria bacterium]
MISPQRGGVCLKTSIGKMEWWNNGILGIKNSTPQGGLISDLPIVSKKDLILLNPLFPGPDRFYEAFALTNGLKLLHQKLQFMRPSHQGGPTFQYSSTPWFLILA